MPYSSYPPLWADYDNGRAVAVAIRIVVITSRVVAARRADAVNS